MQQELQIKSRSRSCLSIVGSLIFQPDSASKLHKVRLGMINLGSIRFKRHDSRVTYHVPRTPNKLRLG
jgi:hypothetical protein